MPVRGRLCRCPVEVVEDKRDVAPMNGRDWSAPSFSQAPNPGEWTARLGSGAADRALRQTFARNGLDGQAYAAETPPGRGDRNPT